jgi:hypothetical protein
VVATTQTVGAATRASKTCRGNDCSSTKLIGAHIIPRGFAKLIRSDPKTELLQVQGHEVDKAFPQLGETDNDILCAECDGKLGKHDAYAVDVCRFFKPDKSAASFEDPKIDAERFSKFILSLLWRASISKRGRYCGVVTFGPYERPAREIIFGARSISEMKAFKLLVSKLRSPVHDVNRIITDPVRFKFDGLNGYVFFLSGFRIHALLDGQKLATHFDALLINRTKVFRGTYLEFEDLPEFEWLSSVFGTRQT